MNLWCLCINFPAIFTKSSLPGPDKEPVPGSLGNSLWFCGTAKCHSSRNLLRCVIHCPAAPHSAGHSGGAPESPEREGSSQHFPWIIPFHSSSNTIELEANPHLWLFPHARHHPDQQTPDSWVEAGLRHNLSPCAFCWMMVLGKSLVKPFLNWQLRCKKLWSARFWRFPVILH